MGLQTNKVQTKQTNSGEDKFLDGDSEEYRNNNRRTHFKMIFEALFLRAFIHNRLAWCNQLQKASSKHKAHAAEICNNLIHIIKTIL